ncbi:MAG TPA: heavy metal translocating P-type ATPase [Gaiellaceae bacterium]|nr:heavy metal translocating P-type ATPase [Gaiellaceae bacterium]
MKLKPLSSATDVAALCLVLLAVGGVLRLTVSSASADAAWGGAVALLLPALGWSVVKSLLERDLGVDAIALVSMVGALALGQYLAGAVIALMLAGGNALEERAGVRARRELTLLVSRAPHTARVERDGQLVETPVDDVVPGDLVVVRSGEVLPVDGVVESGEAVLDESALTGESLPVVRRRGHVVRSGAVSTTALRLRATRSAAESAYASLVRLVRQAETQRAPFVRMADRYAAFFLPLTTAVAAIAWVTSGDPVRALAVFVVATPCPLILAAPIALLSGVSRAARAGIVVKGAGVIERLGSARTVLLDKTGTLTLGSPHVERIETLDGIGEAETLRLAASLDQLSLHPLAVALVGEAHERRLPLELPTAVAEEPGRGIEGAVGEHRVAVGSGAFLRERGYDGVEARGRALVGADGRLVGAISFADPPRDDALGMVERLHASGIRRVAMLTGDRAAAAEAIGAVLHVDQIYAEQSPEEKLAVVRAIAATPGLAPVVMVGDGINDAPALALADVGIAMGSAGATASSETADAIVLVERVDRVVDAIRIGRRSLSIARQSVLAGIGLSLAAMAFAALGFIPPLGGALLQEGIDVAVIVNALRALTT